MQPEHRGQSQNGLIVWEINDSSGDYSVFCIKKKIIYILHSSVYSHYKSHHFHYFFYKCGFFSSNQNCEINITVKFILLDKATYGEKQPFYIKSSNPLTLNQIRNVLFIFITISSISYKIMSPKINSIMK